MKIIIGACAALLLTACARHANVFEGKTEAGGTEQFEYVVSETDGEMIRNGAYIEYYPTGEKMIEGNYANGREDGVWKCWHVNGQLRSQGSYVNGREDGKWTYWHVDGTVEWEKWYKDGNEIEPPKKTESSGSSRDVERDEMSPEARAERRAAFGNMRRRALEQNR